eukprot:9471220-Pyramimonas_sp.AAC.1
MARAGASPGGAVPGEPGPGKGPPPGNGGKPPALRGWWAEATPGRQLLGGLRGNDEKRVGSMKGPPWAGFGPIEPRIEPHGA